PEGIRSRINMDTNEFRDASFFFSSSRRHTSFSRDWSSDVCSSDLLFSFPVRSITLSLLGGVSEIDREAEQPRQEFWIAFSGPLQIGRASCRERVKSPDATGSSR